MKANISLIILLLSYANAFSQGNLPAAAGASNNIIGNTAFVEVYDNTGKPLTSTNKEVLGSPFLNETWGKGEVRLKNGFLLKNAELQFDLYDNELHFKKDNIAYKFVDSLKEFAMEFKDGEEMQSVFFRSGYPPIEKKYTPSFYQVLADGKKVQLLKYVSKEIREKYNYMAPLSKEYQLSVSYYVYDAVTGTIKNIKLSKNVLIKAMPQYENSIRMFSKKKDYKFNSENEIVQLFIELNQ
jgi:hypothetical protein